MKPRVPLWRRHPGAREAVRIIAAADRKMRELEAGANRNAA